MQIRIKKYEREENEHIKHLIELCFEDESLLSILNTKHLQFAYSAYYDYKLIGFVFAWKSNFHPYCTYFRILSHPLYIFELEELLLSLVKKHSLDNRPLQTSVWETSYHLINIYKNNGFKEIRRTYSPKLVLSSLDDNFNNPKTNRIQPLEEIIKNNTLMDQLIALVKSVYEQTHRINPVATIKDNQWKELIFTDDLIQKGSYVYLDEHEKNIVAYSFLHTSDKKDALELGWCGATNDEHIGFIPELVLNQIQYAKKHGFQYLIGEFDTTDKFGMTILNNFPFTPAPTWITFQK